jgi:hypothetical protein
MVLLMMTEQEGAVWKYNIFKNLGINLMIRVVLFMNEKTDLEAVKNTRSYPC